MSNPVAIERTIHWRPGEGDWEDRESVPAYREIVVHCPGCGGTHSLTVEILDPRHKRSDGSDQPVWGFDGNMERPTFSPSLLVYSSVHICEGEHPPVTICDREFEQCGHRGHGYVWTNEAGEQRSFKVYEEIPEGWVQHTFGGGIGEHPRNPAYGNCHSFIRDGVWQFLGDSAHHLAGQSVPLPPLPDWYLDRG